MLVLNSNGNLTYENYVTIISEINNNIQESSLVVAANANIDVTRKVTLHKLKHTSGVGALTSNQIITFCPDIFTYIHGWRCKISRFSLFLCRNGVLRSGREFRGTAGHGPCTHSLLYHDSICF